ncbi:acyltransferase [Rheinheimera mangrovi]|uniref:acyltransferase n=1 Tax=Rheinheimera mangrovi TaxID=2498451 RepID=UPI000F8C7CCD|nr:acyltransferase [Rheinheimera mangrovi]
MAYLSQNEINAMGFASVGRNVKISDKAAIYNPETIKIGDNSRIDDFCIISGLVEIGRYCHITPMCLVAGGIPGVYLSDFSTLAYGVKVFAQSDDYTGETMTNSLIPKKFKNEKFEPVYICRHVIIGAGSVIFPGVVIAEGCAIGSMTLVNRSTEDWGIYTGIPAKRKSNRSKNLLNLEKIFFQSEDENDPI